MQSYDFLCTFALDLNISSMGKEKMMVKSFDELTKKELYDVLFLRAKVFVVEQECAYLDLDYLDQNVCIVCCMTKTNWWLMRV